MSTWEDRSCFRCAMLATASLGSSLLLASAGPASLHWSVLDARDLGAAIEASRDEGLDPADYDQDALHWAIARNDPALLDETATRSALKLARDYAMGHAPPAARVGWHIERPTIGDGELRSVVANGLKRSQVGDALAGLLPRHAEYRALKAELANGAERSRAAQLRVNMDRWRWMPRDLGSRYLLVNVPAYALRIYSEGKIVDERAVIVGKRSTPTPQFSAQVTGVIFNPWWEVPKSIVAESVGRLLRRDPAKARAQGYRVTTGSGGSQRIRQAPGPDNALGQAKLVMPNRFSVYLHDTPAKGRFAEPVRALSHGCIRVDGAIDFAALLLADDPAWNRASIDRVVAERRTAKAPLAQSLPVYVTYFTAATDARGTVVYFPDVYGRDAPVRRELDRPEPFAIAGVADERCPV